MLLLLVKIITYKVNLLIFSVNKVITIEWVYLIDEEIQCPKVYWTTKKRL
mgnify:CR=1 FL=1